MRVSTDRNQKAFTLIELLVVIGIIGILAALLLPALSAAKAHAHSTKCKSLLRQLAAGLQMYVDENRWRYPYYEGLPDASLNGAVGAANTARWSAKLFPYYPLKWADPAYHCPAYKGGISLGMGSFAYNAFGVGRKGRRTANQELGLGGALSWQRPRRGQTTEHQVQSPSEMFAVGESRWLSQGSRGVPGGNDYMICGLLTPNRGGLAFDPTRHGKNYNQLFCDGHVSAMSPWVLFNPTNTAPMWNHDHQPHPESWFN